MQKTKCQPRKRKNEMQWLATFGVIFIAIFALVLISVSTTSIESATSEKVWAAIEMHGFQPIDGTEEGVKQNPFIKKVIGFSRPNINFLFYTFLDDSAAQSFYTNVAYTVQMQSPTHVTGGGARANYQVISYFSDAEFWYAMRIDNTVLYTYGDKEYQEELMKIINEVGYVM